MVDQNDLSTSLEYGTVEESAHLWTIQDAKNGDVLVCKDDKKPFISAGFDKFCPKYPKAYCGICDDGTFIASKGDSFWAYSDVCPATKEQRDVLEKAMADAGYTFDAEKKELKKIEQKSAWSEEDERCLTNAIYACEQMSDEDYNHSQGYIDAIKWFKSLKDRTTWKPSDEQLKSLQGVIDVGYFTSYPNSLETLYEQLKKLKG